MRNPYIWLACTIRISRTKRIFAVDACNGIITNMKQNQYMHVQGKRIRMTSRK